ncbi:hypothetical protein ABZ867_09355, partial [Streptomyces cinnamoneus]
MAAAEQPGFTEIETVADEQPLGVVPGAGWRVRKSGQGPLPEAHDPVAFVVYSTHVVPVVSLPPAGDYRGAVGGVEVCLAKPIDDVQAKLRLPAGLQTLRG